MAYDGVGGTNLTQRGGAVVNEHTDLTVDAEVLARHDRPGPRYTSYPPANVWDGAFPEARYRQALAEAAEQTGPLSLYVHIPFCHGRCAYCGCNVIVNRKPGAEDRYLDYVERELALLAGFVGHRPVAQLHWGGGTPTFLTVERLERLHAAVAGRFDFAPGAELALEADPRATTREQVRVLRALGFNRVSLGVQDFDPAVQEAIGRNQTEEQTRRLMDWLREEGFGGINIDLVYGLPKQNLEAWDYTLAAIAELAPGRLAVYSYAHLPSKLHNQRRIVEEELPPRETKYELFALARRRLLEAGYRAIGMDHFAAPGNELTQAMDAGRLRRNFMGYTVQPGADMLGVGASAIGDIQGVYAQNAKKLSTYYQALDEGRFPVHSGHALSPDDAMRRWAIHELMCNFTVDHAAFKARFGQPFAEAFAGQEAALKDLEAADFIERGPDRLAVKPMGRLFIRNVAMAFDAYLGRAVSEKAYSRTV
ncbi:MAG: oxygen-independent coproporphyrinogen III oxidase [Candidatus Hydrogenedentota bacterium]